MLSLQSNNIVDVFVFVDDNVPEPPKPQGGRPKLVRDSEIITLLIWNCLTSTRQRTLKDIFTWILLYHKRDVPKIGTYGAFVAHCHRLLPEIIRLLGSVLVPAEIQFMDSSKLPVCRNHRADRYKTAPEVTGWGKNWQGFWYGFKLHASVDSQGRFAALTLTPADVYDGQIAPLLVRPGTKIVVGDSHYGDKNLRAKMKDWHNVVVVAPPHHKQKTQIMAEWQQKLLTARGKVETTFDYLKEHMNLVSSFPRSKNGYLLHYMRIILGYQIGLGF